jgi:hypothetical protein
VQSILVAEWSPGELQHLLTLLLLLLALAAMPAAAAVAATAAQEQSLQEARCMLPLLLQVHATAAHVSSASSSSQ